MPANLPLQVLWIDDDIDLTADLAHYFADLGYVIDCAGDLAGGRERLAAKRYHLTIVDLTLPDGSGLTLLRDADRQQTGEVVVMTGHGSVKTAIESLRHQVFDYLMKPVELSELRNTLERVRKQYETQSATTVTPTPQTVRAVSGVGIEELLTGRSPPMRHTQSLVVRAAASDITVLIQGESGTGKEVVARSLHQLSNRASGPFVALNCGAVSPSLIASELFGHEKGSFTGAHRQHHGIFERAEGGTLFLDEVTEMPIDLQATLLRVLETGTVVRVGGSEEIPVHARVVAATNRDPMQYVHSGRFRLDLYYRLQVFPIVLPPLKERGDDVLLLAEHFLARARSLGGTAPQGFTPEARAMLLAHDWPGNVREMRNVIERALLLCPDAFITPDHLMLNPVLRAPGFGLATPAAPMPASVPSPAKAPQTAAALKAQEQALILQVLGECGGNRTRAAAKLGISVKTLYNKLKRYGEPSLEAQRSGS
jgi:two-component system, NtrC family, response regulator AtoC